MKLKDMKIGMRLGLAFGLLVLMLVAAGLLGYGSVKSVAGTTIAMINGDAHVAENAAEARSHILGMRRFEKDIFLNIGKEDKVEEYLKKWNGQHDELTKEHLPELEKTVVSQSERDALKKIKEDLAVYEAGFKKVYGEIRAGKIKTAPEANAAMAPYKDETHNMEKISTELSEAGNKRMDAMTPTLDAVVNRTVLFIVILILASVALSAVIGTIITRGIAGPVREIASVAGKIALGDIDHVIAMERKDEIGTLAQSFREMIVYMKGMAGAAEEIAEGDLRSDVTPKSDKDALGNAFKKMISGLRGMVAEIRAGASQIASATTQIAATAEESSKNNDSTSTSVEETTATMHEMSANIQSVAKNSQSQASSVTETSSSIEQMVTSIQRIAGTVKQLADISQNAKKAVDGSLDAVDKSVKGTDEINRAIARASDTISALGSRAEDIGKIVDVIDDIAEQTNLLALNAAIEAARAGEQGMGFAVVAEEVRKLAERSVKSTKEISELITGIQKEAQEAVRQMEKSTQTVEKGVELSRKVENTLQDISGSVTEVDRYAREIGAATQEQSSGSTQIARAAENLREVTHEITSATDEQATAAEQIVKTMEKMREMVQQNAAASVQLASSAEELSAQAERFQQIVGKFVVDDNDGQEAETQRTPAKRRLIGGNGAGRKTSEHKELVKA
jgi:methyl-accepting chemotaxis protein